MMELIKAFFTWCVFLLIHGTAGAPRRLHSSEALSTESNRFVFINFDDLATDPATGVGPHHSFSNKGINFESFTVINTTAAAISKPPLIDLYDITCATTWPNAVIGSRNFTHGSNSWPRFSIRDLYAAQNPSVDMDDILLNIIQLSLSPLGYVPGPREKSSGVLISATFLHLPKGDTNFNAQSQTTIPPFIPGQPFRDPNIKYSQMYSFYPGGRRFPSHSLLLREWFGSDFAAGIDVVEIYGEQLVMGKDGDVSGPVDWPFCIDDILLEVVDKKASLRAQAEEQKGSRSSRAHTICSDDGTCHTGSLSVPAA